MPPNVAVQILGKAGAILGLDILKHTRCLGVDDHNIEGEAELLASPCEVLVVVDGGTDT